MLKRIKALLGREGGLSRELVATLERLPREERAAPLGVALHELCVKNAARFVADEHRRADSPFRDLPKTRLFHEMLVVNFWVLERLCGGAHPALMEQLYRHYAASFVWGRESPHPELLAALRVKFEAYATTWDDYSGHQDAFARRAIDIIFGGPQPAAETQAAFWLISFADRAMRDFAGIAATAQRLLGNRGG